MSAPTGILPGGIRSGLQESYPFAFRVDAFFRQSSLRSVTLAGACSTFNAKSGERLRWEFGNETMGAEERASPQLFMKSLITTIDTKLCPAE